MRSMCEMHCITLKAQQAIRFYPSNYNNWSRPTTMFWTMSPIQYLIGCTSTGPESVPSYWSAGSYQQSWHRELLHINWGPVSATLLRPATARSRVREVRYESWHAGIINFIDNFKSYLVSNKCYYSLHEQLLRVALLLQATYANCEHWWPLKRLKTAVRNLWAERGWILCLTWM